jgi:hypothetical protein
MAIGFPLTANDVARVIVADGSTNTTITINKPANVVDGELMLLRVSSNAAINPNSISISGGGYWTAIGSNYPTNGSFNIHMARFWAVWHTGDATTWTATIGASDLDDESFVQRVTGADTADPIGAVAAAFSDGNDINPVSPTVTTTAANSAVIFDIGVRNGNNLTTEDTGAPSGTTLIHSKRTRSFSSGLISGIAYEMRPSAGSTGSRTWSSYLNNGAVWSGYSFEVLAAASAQTITDINSGNPVSGDTSGNTFTTIVFTESITDVEVGGLACTSVVETSGSGTFTVPPPVDGEVYPELGVNQDVVISGATQSATLAKSFVLTGYTVTTLTDPELVDTTYFTANFDVTPLTNDLMITVTDDVTPTADGGGTTDNPKTTTVLHWKRSTGVMYIYSFRINEAGVDNRGLTAVGLTSVGLTAIGLTAVGL